MRLLDRIRFGNLRELLCSVQNSENRGGSPAQSPTGGAYGGGFGGGSGGGGGDVQLTPMAVQQQRVGAVLATVPVFVPTAGKPVNGPTYPIPAGYYVEVAPIPGNAGNAFFSRVSANAAISGPRELVASTQSIPRQIDVRDLSELWINAANSGEGVQFTVRRSV